MNISSDFVCLDLETTGRSAKKDRILLLDAVRLHQGAVTDSFRSFVYTETPLHQGISHLTGITDSDLQAAPSLEPVLASFLEFTDSCPLAAYHGSFCLKFLQSGCAAVGLPAPSSCLDLLSLVKAQLPGLHSYTEAAVAEKLGLPPFPPCSGERTARILLKLASTHHETAQINGLS